LYEDQTLELYLIWMYCFDLKTLKILVKICC